MLKEAVMNTMKVMFKHANGLLANLALILFHTDWARR
jgi:hypothetical protein